MVYLQTTLCHVLVDILETVLLTYPHTFCVSATTYTTTAIQHPVFILAVQAGVVTKCRPKFKIETEPFINAFELVGH